MSTPRRRYRIAVTLTPWTPAGWTTLKRTSEDTLPWCWCPHWVRATSNATAHAKARTEHEDSATCQALDQEVREVIAANGLA